MAAKTQHKTWTVDNVEFLRDCGAAILKMAIVEIFQCRESIWDIIIYPYIKF
jgi:hypothetical protein